MTVLTPFMVGLAWKARGRARAVALRTAERERMVWYRRAIPVMGRALEIEYRAVVRAVRDGGAESAVSRAEAAIGANAEKWATTLARVYVIVGDQFARRAMTAIEGGAKAARVALEGEDVPEGDTLARGVVLDWLRTESAKRVKRITTTTTRRIREILTEGVAAGEGVEPLVERLEAVYLREIIPHRREVIARTETLTASSVGSRAGAKATGLALDHVWVSTRDNRTRATHVEANGSRVDLDEPFMVGGERMMFPRDTSLGASAENTIQCRCVEVYEPK